MLKKSPEFKKLHETTQKKKDTFNGIKNTQKNEESFTTQHTKGERIREGALSWEREEGAQHGEMRERWVGLSRGSLGASAGSDGRKREKSCRRKSYLRGLTQTS